MSSSLPHVAIVGATGAVGVEFLHILEQRRFPLASLRLLASPRSAGKKLPFAGSQLPVEPLTPESFKGIDIALFSAGGSISKEFGPIATAAGASVVDNSSAFRMTQGVPLVIPEVNPDAMPMKIGPRGNGAGIIANPNCTTIILLMALTPLRRAFGVSRAVVSTYQAASGAGAKGMDELLSQTDAALHGREVVPGMFPEPYAFNLFSHNTAIDPVTGLNVEESKVIHETHKIWSDASVRISPTCIRVPVLRAHAESVNVTLSRAATLGEVRAALENAAGVKVIDDRANNKFPTPLKASGGDDVLIGRLRADLSQLEQGVNPDGPTRGFDLFICGDQLRKGAALNAVQIAEMLLARAS
ncbi:MAG: aspartate-semialdehyde dehydrogenase [Planctomycetota bacterium]|nr:aspartate-semialdehyde dehydrogenase [Planctomycetota bacterium]